MTLKEVYQKEYMVKSDQLEARWAQDEPKIREAMIGFPEYDPNKAYTPEEVSKLFWMDQERHKAITKLSEQGIRPAAELATLANKRQGVTSFVRSLPVGMVVEKPKEHSVAAFYTAARNLGYKISIVQAGSGYVVKRIS